AINGYKKNNMINGFDDIDYLQNIKEDIKAFADKLPY
ncbi:MAG TPA: 3-isopropylmalate dehydratase small subunit, partial [Flavobacterium sp.]